MSKTFISSRDLIKDIKVSNIIIYVIRDSLNNLYNRLNPWFGLGHMTRSCDLASVA
jgi:hypothetical protein